MNLISVAVLGGKYINMNFAPQKLKLSWLFLKFAFILSAYVLTCSKLESIACD